MSRSGRPKGPHDKKLEKKLIGALKQKPTISNRDLAKKCSTTSAMVHRMKQRNSFRTYKKQKVPKRSKQQHNTAIRRSKRLYKLLCNSKNSCILMDDETYVKKDFSTLPGASYYTVQDGEDIDEEQKSIGVEKYWKKLLIWQAICSCDVRSRSFFSTGTIDAENYVKECLKKRLLPLIRNHEGPVLFWPDLASAHYARTTQEWLKNANIPYVAKYDNPPNCPALRPIERYWALVKQHLRKEARAAVNDDDFKKKWVKYSAKVTTEVVQKLMEGIKRKVRAFSRQPLKK